MFDLDYWHKEMELFKDIFICPCPRRQGYCPRPLAACPEHFIVPEAAARLVGGAITLASMIDDPEGVVAGDLQEALTLVIERIGPDWFVENTPAFARHGKMPG